jgi:cell wall-associated NlpC family hydrolase
MHSDKSSSDLIHDDHDLHDFQQRAVDHEHHKSIFAKAHGAVKTQGGQALRGLPKRLSRAPRRYMLHLLVLLLLPVGLVVSRNATEPATIAEANTIEPTQANMNRPVLGVTTMTHRNEPTLAKPAPNEDEQPTEGDAPISSPDYDDSMVIPVTRPADIQPSTAPASVSAELANLRNGPGTEFDRLDKLNQGAKLEVTARHNEWVQVRTEGGQEGWLSLDVLDLDAETADALPAAQSVPTPPPAKVATITEDKLNLRDGPGREDYVSLAKLSAGQEVSLLANFNGWYQIDANGTVGWVSQDFLAIQPGVAERITVAESVPPANPDLVGSVTDEGVNLRSGPSTKFDSLGKLSVGAELSLLARNGDWLKVETAKGTKGWISNELVDATAFIMRRVPYTDNIPSLPKPAAPKATPKAKAKPAAPSGGGGGGGGGGSASGDVAGLAWNYVGSRYVWGGEGPGGFDCSGLTKFLYRQVGVSLPHSARGQYSSAYGSFVSADNLQPGDLLFYANTAGPGITHVGIYVGGNTMVNATTPAGGVQAVNIWSSYWSAHFYGALRPYR